MNQTAVESPSFLIIAGPNGSGKSSAYQDYQVSLAGRSFRIINPDLFARRIHDAEQLDLENANLQAVQRIETWLETSILAGHTVGVETVLSTAKYRRLVGLAKRLGFTFHLLYVVLDSPDRNVERVRIRVERGGHDVPEESIRKRYQRSLGQLPWFLDAADYALIYDNSGPAIRMIAKKERGEISLDPDALPAVAEAVRSIGAE